MSGENVSEADYALCGDLDPGERTAMRADLLKIPLCGSVCDHCLRAWAINIGFGCLMDEPTKH
jgi:hypothetical protein